MALRSESAVMRNAIRDLKEVILDEENALIFEKNISVPLKASDLPVRANVYRPIDTSCKYPVLVTYGPYGKDIFYGESVLLFSYSSAQSSYLA